MCNEHQIPLIRVDSNKKLGEWSGLCKIDKEGKPRKVCGCSVVVIKVNELDHQILINSRIIQVHGKSNLIVTFFFLFQDFGEETPALDVVKEHLRSQS